MVSERNIQLDIDKDHRVAGPRLLDRVDALAQANGHTRRARHVGVWGMLVGVRNPRIREGEKDGECARKLEQQWECSSLSQQVGAPQRRSGRQPITKNQTK